MGSEWPLVALGEVVEIFDGPHATPRKTDSGPVFLGISNLSGGRLDLTTTEHLSSEDFGRWTRRVLPQSGDLVFSYETRLGEAALIPRGLTCCLGRRMGLLRAKHGKVDPRFLLYAYLGNEFQETLRANTNPGSTVDRILLSEMSEFPIHLPPLDEQRAIAHILGTLDDKIELNRRMNETLEAMARALFTSWFVDFDPVRAKAEGRDTGLPQHIADLFPDAFEDSELGEVPQGWRVGTLAEIAEHPRRSVKPDAVEPSTPYIGLEHMPRRCIALSEWGDADGLESNKFQFQKGEILFGKLRPYFHKVGVAPVDGVASTDIVIVAPRAEHWFGLVLGHVSSDSFVSYTDGTSSGTRMPRTSWDDMKQYAAALPDDFVARAYTDQLQPLISRMLASIYESRILTALRDTFLPKLISGEVRVGIRGGSFRRQDDDEGTVSHSTSPEEAHNDV